MSSSIDNKKMILSSPEKVEREEQKIEDYDDEKTYMKIENKNTESVEIREQPGRKLAVIEDRLWQVEWEILMTNLLKLQ